MEDKGPDKGPERFRWVLRWVFKSSLDLILQIVQFNRIRVQYWQSLHIVIFERLRNVCYLHNKPFITSRCSPASMFTSLVTLKNKAWRWRLTFYSDIDGRCSIVKRQTKQEYTKPHRVWFIKNNRRKRLSGLGLADTTVISGHQKRSTEAAVGNSCLKGWLVLSVGSSRLKRMSKTVVITCHCKRPSEAADVSCRQKQPSEAAVRSSCRKRPSEVGMRSGCWMGPSEGAVGSGCRKGPLEAAFRSSRWKQPSEAAVRSGFRSGRLKRPSEGWSKSHIYLSDSHMYWKKVLSHKVDQSKLKSHIFRTTGWTLATWARTSRYFITRVYKQASTQAIVISSCVFKVRGPDQE